MQDEGQENTDIDALGSANGTKALAVFEQPKHQQQRASAQAKHRAWTVVNHSPKNRNSTGANKTTIASMNTNISNSFDVLVEDHVSVVKKDDENMQQVVKETR